MANEILLMADVLSREKSVDKDVNHPNWMILTDPVLQPFRK